MRNPLRKAMILLVTAVILMFLVAAGIDTPSLRLSEIISRSILPQDKHYLVIVALFSAWMVTVGMMCRRLKNIPGVKGKSINSNKIGI